MATDVDITPHEEYLEVVVSGEHDLEEAIGRFPRVIAACRITGQSKVLIDFRGYYGTPAAIQRILYILGIHEQYTEHIASGGHPLRIAFVGSPPHVGGTYDPGLEIGKDLGLPWELFTDIEKAYEWLDVPRA